LEGEASVDRLPKVGTDQKDLTDPTDRRTRFGSDDAREAMDRHTNVEWNDLAKPKVRNLHNLRPRVTA
jgi:hypothetical protein